MCSAFRILMKSNLETAGNNLPKSAQNHPSYPSGADHQKTVVPQSLSSGLRPVRVRIAAPCIADRRSANRYSVAVSVGMDFIITAQSLSKATPALEDLIRAAPETVELSLGCITAETSAAPIFQEASA